MGLHISPQGKVTYGDVVADPPVIGFKIDKTRKTYIKKIFIDLTWSRYLWQYFAGGFQGNLKQRARYVVKRIVRRQGKTYEAAHWMVEDLVKCPHEYPVGHYFAPEKQQLMRSAWKNIRAAVRNIPGAVVDERGGVVKFPKPTLKDPANFCIIYLLSMRGGTMALRGDYSDSTVIEEAEGVDIKAIEEIVMYPSIDRKGKAYILGTVRGLGNMQYWEKFAVKRMKQADREKKGKLYPGEKLMANRHEWYVVKGNAYDLQVYPKEQLDIERENAPKTFEREMMGIDRNYDEGFYFKKAIEQVLEQRKGFYTERVKYNANLPLRAYYDLGIGKKKSDRSAIIICQFDLAGIKVLWGDDTLEKGYSALVRFLKESPYGNFNIYEHVLPHDAAASEQSDAIPKSVKFEEELKVQGCKYSHLSVGSRTKDPQFDTSLVRDYIADGKVVMNAPHCERLLEALMGHRRSKVPKEDFYRDEPAKTADRDLADDFRYMVTHYHENEYQAGGLFEGPVEAAIPFKAGGHPLEGSILEVGANHPQGNDLMPENLDTEW